MFRVSMEQPESVATKVLAVDDKPGNLLVLSAVLEPLEVEVIAAATGRDALKLAAQDEFAAILLDVVMPELDGFETLAKLRMIPSALTTPVVLVTAHELDGQAIERVQGMGTVDYVLKPIEPILLRSKVAALVSLFRRGKEIRRRDAALAAKDRDIADAGRRSPDPFDRHRDVRASATHWGRRCQSVPRGVGLHHAYRPPYERNDPQPD